MPASVSVLLEIQVAKKCHFCTMMRKFILRVQDEPGPRVVSELRPGGPQWPPESLLAKACQPGPESLPGSVNSLQCRTGRRIPLPAMDI